MSIEIIKTIIVVALVIAVYTAHIDLHAQLHRFHRRKQALLTPIPSIIKKQNYFQPHLPSIPELPSSTSTFGSRENRSLLPTSIDSINSIDLSTV